MARKARPKLRAKDKATFIIASKPPEPGTFAARVLEEVFGVTATARPPDPALPPFPATSAVSPLAEIPTRLRAPSNKHPAPLAEQLDPRIVVVAHEATGESLDEDAARRLYEDLSKLLAVAASAIVGRCAESVLPCQRELFAGLSSVVARYEKQLRDEVVRARRVRIFEALLKAYPEVLRLHGEKVSVAEQRARVAPTILAALAECYPGETNIQLDARVADLWLSADEITTLADESDAQGKAYKVAQIKAAEHDGAEAVGATTVYNHAKETTGIEVAAYLERPARDEHLQTLMVRALDELLPKARDFAR